MPSTSCSAHALRASATEPCSWHTAHHAEPVELEPIEQRAPLRMWPVDDGAVEREDVEGDERQRHAPVACRDTGKHPLEIARPSLAGNQFAVEYYRRVDHVGDRAMQLAHRTPRRTV